MQTGIIDQYSSSSLQDFVDCEKKFELKHLLNIHWPAIKNEPFFINELKTIQGKRFHHLVHQHQLGIPTEVLNSIATEIGLEHWWQEYLKFIAAQNPTKNHWPETQIQGPSKDGTKLIARYDLLIRENNGCFLIYDWKTSEFRTSDDMLKNKIQTRLYPMLLCNSGCIFNENVSIEPKKVKMLYWFTNFPDKPYVLTYSKNAFQADLHFIESIIDTIKNKNNSSFEKTTNHKLCNFCIYRSLCDRGVKAGQPKNAEEEVGFSNDIFELDLHEIGEIEY